MQSTSLRDAGSERAGQNLVRLAAIDFAGHAACRACGLVRRAQRDNRDEEQRERPLAPVNSLRCPVTAPRACGLRQAEVPGRVLDSKDDEHGFSMAVGWGMRIWKLGLKASS